MGWNFANVTARSRSEHLHLMRRTRFDCYAVITLGLIGQGVITHRRVASSACTRAEGRSGGGFHRRRWGFYRAHTPRTRAARHRWFCWKTDCCAANQKAADGASAGLVFSGSATCRHPSNYQQLSQPLELTRSDMIIATV